MDEKKTVVASNHHILDDMQRLLITIDTEYCIREN